MKHIELTRFIPQDNVCEVMAKPAINGSYKVLDGLIECKKFLKDQNIPECFFLIGPYSMIVHPESTIESLSNLYLEWCRNNEGLLRKAKAKNIQNTLIPY